MVLIFSNVIFTLFFPVDSILNYLIFSLVFKEDDLLVPSIPIPACAPLPSIPRLVANIELRSYMPDHIDFVAYFIRHAAHRRLIPTSSFQFPQSTASSTNSSSSPSYSIITYLPESLDSSTVSLLRGPIISLPTETEKWHVTKGPFVHDKSKEIFERKTFKRMLQAFDADRAVIEDWVF